MWTTETQKRDTSGLAHTQWLHWDTGMNTGRVEGHMTQRSLGEGHFGKVCKMATEMTAFGYVATGQGYAILGIFVYLFEGESRGMTVQTNGIDDSCPVNSCGDMLGSGVTVGSLGASQVGLARSVRRDCHGQRLLLSRR